MPSSREGRSKGFVALSWVLVIAWATVVFCMSANTGNDLDQGSGFVSLIFQWLKNLQAQFLPAEIDLVNPTAHFCEYAILGLLLCNALRLHLPLRRALLLAILCASLYAVSDELHQYFVPGRACDPADWLVDTCGAALGAGIFYGVLHRRILHRQNPSSVKDAPLS